MTSHSRVGRRASNGILVKSKPVAPVPFPSSPSPMAFSVAMALRMWPAYYPPEGAKVIVK